MKWLRAIVEAYKAHRLLRQTRRELYALTDHMLRDIGLRRDQIEFIRLP